MMKKSLLFIFFVSLLLLTVAATVSAEDVVLKFFHPSLSPEVDEYWQSVADDFSASHDGVTVELSEVDEQTYKTKLNITLRSNDAPDVFYQWCGSKMEQTVAAGYGENLQPYYDKYGWADKLSGGAKSSATVNGDYYLACYNMTVYTFFYNKDLFAKYNLEVPTTWDELNNVIKTFQDNGVAPFIMGNKSKWEAQFPWTNLLIHKYGLDVWNGLKDNTIPFTDERVVDAFAMMQTMAANNELYPNPNSYDYAEAKGPIANGEAAMLMYMGSFAARRVFEEDQNIGVFTWPAMDSSIGQLPQAFCEGALMINTKSENKDLAAEFIDYVLSAPVQTKFMEINGGIATNSEADKSVLNNLVVEQLDIVDAATGDLISPTFDMTFDAAITSEYLDAMQSVIGGEITPEEAAEAVEKAAVEVRGEVAP